VLRPTFHRSSCRGAWSGRELGLPPHRNGILENKRVARAGVTVRGPRPRGSKSSYVRVRVVLISHIRAGRALAGRAGGLWHPQRAPVVWTCLGPGILAMGAPGEVKPNKWRQQDLQEGATAQVARVSSSNRLVPVPAPRQQEDSVVAGTAPPSVAASVTPTVSIAGQKLAKDVAAVSGDAASKQGPQAAGRKADAKEKSRILMRKPRT